MRVVVDWWYRRTYRRDIEMYSSTNIYLVDGGANFSSDLYSYFMPMVEPAESVWSSQFLVTYGRLRKASLIVFVWWKYWSHLNRCGLDVWESAIVCCSVRDDGIFVPMDIGVLIWPSMWRPNSLTKIDPVKNSPKWGKYFSIFSN